MSKLFRISLFIALLFSLSASAENISDSDQSSNITDFFEDILLIVNFNHPHYENIDFLKEVYAPYFPNIVFYGEVTHPEVVQIKTETGWYAHRVLKDALIRYPRFRGYICTQDDCFVQFWNFPGLDKNKIWFHPIWAASLSSDKISWAWWEKPCGRDAVWHAYCKLGKRNVKQLTHNFGSLNIPYSWADFFYLPGKYRTDVLEICDCFDNPDVFLEISVPTILFSLEEKSKIEMLHAYWGGARISADFDGYDPSFHWIHPIKFSSQSSREFVLNLVENHQSQ